MEKIRLQKILANAGLFSRRKAEEAMTGGRVTVNGEVVTALGSKADPERDVIVCDGARIEPQDKIYLIMNKPAGIICSCADDRGRKTVIDLVAEEISKRVFPIGRLDYNTTGLLLLTNDGGFSQKLSHPSHGVVKTYMAKVRGVVTPQTMKKMMGGITIEGEKYRFHNVRVDHVTGKNSALIVELTEGKNLIIKILCQALGHPVAKLARVAYGPLKIGNLGLGDYRHLEKDEVKALLAAAKAKPKPAFMPFHQESKVEPRKEGLPLWKRGNKGDLFIKNPPQPSFSKGGGNQRLKAEPERKIPPRRDATDRGRPFAPPRRDAAERDRPFTPPRRDAAGRDRSFAPPRKDAAGRDRPFAPPRRDATDRDRSFAPPRRDAAERDRSFAPPRRDAADRGRPFAPPRRDAAERDRPFAPPRRDAAGRDRPFAAPRRDSGNRERPSEGRGPGSDRKPARPFSPRTSGAKRR